MPLIATHELTPDRVAALGNTHRRWVYNGLDCCVTQEVFEALGGGNIQGPLTPQAKLIYDFERAMQGPALEMMLRGFRVDESARQQGIIELKKTLAQLEHNLAQLAQAVWQRPLNPRSPDQVKDFFFGAMRLPEVYINIKGERKLSSNRETLEKLSIYPFARPIIATILAIRDTGKLLQVLQTEVDPDGRMRTSYNIAGTETGRWSSSESAFETGTNLQNITRKLRKIFIADAGWKLCSIDAEQSESRDVGFLCGMLFDDWTYLDACEGGDLHTYTARLIWSGLGWTGEPKIDRAIADRLFYKTGTLEFSYRDMSKRGGHGTTYLGTPPTMAKHLKVPVKLIADFQSKFFSAFPAIQRWHTWTATQLQTVQSLTTPFGRERTFFGRSDDMTTLREAVAFVPQSCTADRTNLALWRIWRRLGPSVQLLAQTHDSVTFQYRPADEARIIPLALDLFKVRLQARGRDFIVPGEAKVGWNWGDMHNPAKPIGPGNLYNPNGLMKWKGTDSRERLVGLDRPLA